MSGKREPRQRCFCTMLLLLWAPYAQLMGDSSWCTSGCRCSFLSQEATDLVCGLAKPAAPVLYGVQRLGPSAGGMDQGRVVPWSLPAQPSGGLNNGFRELLKFRAGSELPKAWIRDIVRDAMQDIFLMVLWFL